jgi:hypothetical protein
MKSLTDLENLYGVRVIAGTKPEQVILKPLELVCGMNLGKFGGKGLENP